jgi:serine/threonine protein kinase
MTVLMAGVPESDDTRDALAGELFAQRYRLGPVLGRGSTALVRRAVDERLRRAVALKVLHPDADSDSGADAGRRFAVEARLLAQLRHPGLVELFDYGQVPQGPYLALELIRGPTLRSLIAAGPLAFAETLRIGQAVAGTVSYIHAAGVVHRDVKPSNILLDDAARPRLSDFGVSFAVDAGETAAAGTIVGTAAYLAPEQVLGARADSASDVFALGLVLIECLTGRREYPGPPAESALARLHRLPTVPQGLPRGISQILERMTAWDPAERPDAGECAVVFGRPSPVFQNPALPACAVPESDTDDETTWIHPEVIPPVPPAAGKRRSGGPLSAAVAAMALAAVAGIAMVAFSPAAGSPVSQTPTAMARPQPTTPAGGGSDAVPPYRQPSPSSTLAGSSRPGHR